MDIDVKLLKGLAKEKEISFDQLADAIESALLIAYHRTEERAVTRASASTVRTGM